jgi:ubiquinone biosynthesis protein
VRIFSAGLRALSVLLVGAVTLARVGWAWLGTRGVTDPDARRARFARGVGSALRRAMTRLGATFIKLGQVMSTRPDLFEPELIRELEALQDRLPPFAGAEALRRVEAELGRPVDEAFAELSKEPIAAASVAQVHVGRLLDGTKVAVKILRPDVRLIAERDAGILRALARAVMVVSPRARHADLAGHLEHFIAGILEQTDLRREQRHYAMFRENFADDDRVVFPRVHPELSGETVMTMDFVEGVKVDDIPRAQHVAFARVLREAFLKMLFEDGFLHADLHPGNLLCTPEGKVAMFDVGLVKALPDELLEQYIDFNKCLVMGTADDFVHHLRSYHTYAAGTVDWDRLHEDVEAFTAEFRGKPASEIQFGKLIDRVFAVARRHGIRPVPDMTLMMVGLVTAEGMGKQLDPNTDSFGEVARFLLPILARRNMLPLGAPLPSF